MVIKLTIDGSVSNYDNVKYFSIDERELYIEFSDSEIKLELSKANEVDIDIQHF